MSARRCAFLSTWPSCSLTLSVWPCTIDKDAIDINVPSSYECMQVCVPQHMAVVLTYPERVTTYNLDKLKLRVVNGEREPS